MKVTNLCRCVAVVMCLSLIMGMQSVRCQTAEWKTIIDKADSLSKVGDQDSALVLGHKAFDIAIASYGASDTVVAICYNRLALYNDFAGRFEVAESLYVRAMQIYEERLGPRHLYVGMLQHNMGVNKLDLEKFAEAESLFVSALDIKRENLGDTNDIVADGMHAIAALKQELGQYTDAKEMYEDIIEIREKLHSEDQYNYELAFNSLGNACWTLCEYDQAISAFHKALELNKTYRSEEKGARATYLNNLALVYRDFGRYGEAEKLFKESLQIRSTSMDETHPMLAWSYQNLAEIYHYQGKNSQAEALINRAQQMRMKSLRPDHTDIAWGKSLLANIYRAQNRQEEAEELYLEVIPIFRKVLGDTHPFVAQNMFLLGNLYIDMGEHEKAEAMLRDVLALDSLQFGPTHPVTSVAVGAVANVMTHTGRYDDAEQMFLSELEIQTKTFGRSSAYVGQTLKNLGNVKWLQGDYEKSIAYHQDALEIRKVVLGPAHPYVSQELIQLAQVYRCVGDNDKAMSLDKEAFTNSIADFGDQALALPEPQALRYSVRIADARNQYLSAYFDSDNSSDSTLSDAVRIVEISKGSVSDEIFWRRQAIYEDGDSIAKVLADSLKVARYELSRMVFNPPDSGETELYAAKLDSLRHLTRELETRLAGSSAALTERFSQRSISIDEILAALPEKGVLLDYLRYDYSMSESYETEPRYLAVIGQTGAEPTVVNLGLASEIDALVSEYRAHFKALFERNAVPTRKDLAKYTTLSKQLYSRLIKPCADYVSDASVIMIAPDGPLNLVSFSGLQGDDGRYLCEVVPIHYLSAGRDLARRLVTDSTSRGLIAFGDPDFDASVEDRLHAQERIIADVSDGDLQFANRNIRSGCRNFAEALFSPLPMTKEEVESIAKIWTLERDEPAQVFIGAMASEDRLKAESGGYRVIHVATHGFFLGSECESYTGTNPYADWDNSPTENPLLKTGLVLAGCNLHGRGCDSTRLEDGILSAYEIAEMDLRGTDLVVLSACETGLGDIEDGEGVYGLRRAFQMAGVRTVVSSLWPVSDEITANMMRKHYEHSGRPIYERIRDMQLDQIQKLRNSDIAEHPLLWCGFVATGNWR